MAEAIKKNPLRFIASMTQDKIKLIAVESNKNAQWNGLGLSFSFEIATVKNTLYYVVQ